MSFEGLLLRVDGEDLGVRETLDGITCCSGVSPGMTVGADSVWVTTLDGVARINLET